MICDMAFYTYLNISRKARKTFLRQIFIQKNWKWWKNFNISAKSYTETTKIWFLSIFWTRGYLHYLPLFATLASREQDSLENRYFSWFFEKFDGKLFSSISQEPLNVEKRAAHRWNVYELFFPTVCDIVFYIF